MTGTFSKVRRKHESRRANKYGRKVVENIGTVTVTEANESRRIN